MKLLIRSPRQSEKNFPNEEAKPAEIAIGGSKNAALHLLFCSPLCLPSPNNKREESGTASESFSPSQRPVVRFSNAPVGLMDFRAAMAILHHLGYNTGHSEIVNENDGDFTTKVIEISTDGNVASTSSGSNGYPPNEKHDLHVPSSLTVTTRTSTMILGAVGKRYRSVRIGYPGGCQFNNVARRPVDIHLEGLKALGARVEETLDSIQLYHDNNHDPPLKLEFAYQLPVASVGATINLTMYACTDDNHSSEKGIHTTLTNVAVDPEVQFVVEFLQLCGADIQFLPESRRIVICSVRRLEFPERLQKAKGVRPTKNHYRIPFDRIQTMTYCAWAAAHKIDLRLTGINRLDNVIKPLEVLNGITGATWEYSAPSHGSGGCWSNDGPLQLSGTLIIFGSTECSREKNGNSQWELIADAYPGFPTDLQPIFAVLMAERERQNGQRNSTTAAQQTNLRGTIRDRVFADRVGYVVELQKLGYPITAVRTGQQTFESIIQIHSSFSSASLTNDPANWSTIRSQTDDDMSSMINRHNDNKIIELQCPDLRGGMALLIASSCFLNSRCRRDDNAADKPQTGIILRDAQMILRGYENLVQNAKCLFTDIELLV